eukprot:SAG22_NODE_20731_length_263_cov_0.634146_1_plen_22_part_10
MKLSVGGVVGQRDAGTRRRPDE